MTVLAAPLLTLLTVFAAGVWPLDPTPVVVGDFAPPATPYGAGHRGVDLAGDVGQDVVAAAPGRVTFAGSLAGRGVVVVDHGPTRTTYEPVEATVSVGDLVVAGARIGTLERFGSHCWPAACLHWGLIEGETYLDPLSLVGAAPVRLLPLGQLRADGTDSRTVPTVPPGRQLHRADSFTLPMVAAAANPPAGARSPTTTEPSAVSSR